MKHLMEMYDLIKKETEERNNKLEQALQVSEKFWDHLTNLSSNLKELQDTLQDQDHIELEPRAIKEQQEVLEVGSMQRLCLFLLGRITG